MTIKSLRICKGCNSIKMGNKPCCPDNNWITLHIGECVIMKSWSDKGDKTDSSGHSYELKRCIITGFYKITDNDVWINTNRRKYHHSYFMEKDSQLKLF